MNRYCSRLRDCIDDKLIDFSMTEGISLSDIFTLYDYHQTMTSLIYRNPREHQSKIMTIAYNKTIDEYTK